MDETDNISIMESNGCGCGCGCNDVELHSDHQPDVLLFDEYAEAYASDIAAIKEELMGNGSKSGLRAFIHKEVTDAKDEIISVIPSKVEEATVEDIISIFEGDV